MKKAPLRNTTIALACAIGVLYAAVLVAFVLSLLDSVAYAINVLGRR